MYFFLSSYKAVEFEYVLNFILPVAQDLIEVWR